MMKAALQKTKDAGERRKDTDDEHRTQYKMQRRSHAEDQTRYNRLRTETFILAMWTQNLYTIGKYPTLLALILPVGAHSCASSAQHTLSMIITQGYIHDERHPLTTTIGHHAIDHKKYISFFPSFRTNDVTGFIMF